MNPIDLEYALRSVSPSPPFPPATARTAWQQIGANLGAKQLAKLMAEAESALQTPIPPLTATMFLRYKRTGQREGYKEPRQLRRDLLRALVLAECLEGNGRFLDAVLDLVWAICEESTWATSAHQIELTDIQRPVIDINAAMTALELAETQHLLSQQLDPLLSKRIYDEVDRRCFTPYLTRHDFRWLYHSHLRGVNNWNAVCNGGVAGAAIYLEPDPTRLASILARATHSLQDYLATFDIDGGSSEGPGYWDYGFGYYTILAHLVEQRTGGQVNLFAGEQIRKIATYPLRTSLSPNLYVNFSDCKATVRYSSALLALLAQRLNLPDLAALARQRPGRNRRSNLTWSLRSLFWLPPADAPDHYIPSQHDWFSGIMWMIARYDPVDPTALVLAAKGGHNGEMHNHNDLGSLIVHLNGESLIAEIGRGRYTATYFGAERYTHLVNASLGHSTPVVNGYQQEAGAEHRASLLAHKAGAMQDRLELELNAAYPAEANLASLQRTLILHRQPPSGWVELCDHFAFAQAPGMVESALITFAQVEVGEAAVVLHGRQAALQIKFSTELLTVRLELHRAVDLEDGPVDVHRLVFALRQPALTGMIRLELIPLPRHSD